MWRGYQSCGEVTQPSVARLPNLWRDYLWRGYLVNTNTETNTAIHSSQFDSVGRNGHLLAALPCQK